MKRHQSNAPNANTRKRQMTERRVHRELDALAAQLQQVRLEAKFKYIAERARRERAQTQGQR